MKRRAKPKRGNIALRLTLLLVALVAVAGAGWCWWVYAQIESYAGQDQAAPSEYSSPPAPPSVMISGAIPRL